MKSEGGAAARRAPAGEEVLHGLGVAAGVAIGPAYLRESGGVEVPEYAISASRVKEEQRRLHEAAQAARRGIRLVRERSGVLSGEAAHEIGLLLDAHLHMLDGDARLIRGVGRRIASELLNAEAAVQEEVRALCEQFARMEDPYFAARSSDIREIGKRLLSGFAATPGGDVVTAGAIIVTDELTPADTVLFEPGKAAGFIACSGGPESHAAILARALCLPAVVAVGRALTKFKPGDTVVVDGGAGIAVSRPQPATLARYRAMQDSLAGERKRLATLRDRAARTRDGRRIKLLANIELPREYESIKDSGAEGIGLLRSEFLYMNRTDTPDEKEQTRFLTDVVRNMDGLPITVRTLDVGGEKLANALSTHLNEVENPALGLRAIRFSLKFPDLFETQLGAILRASREGPIRILLPMVSSVAEVEEARAILERAAAKRGGEGALPPLGVMIETPAAALAADALARHCDFFSIGTNDLIMYTLAIDRGDREVAHLYTPLHPAHLRLIRMTSRAAWQQGIPLAVCGEMAGDARYTALLIGLGVEELSMAPAAVPKVKERILRIDAAKARRMASEVLQQPDSVGIGVMVEAFNRALHSESVTT